MISRPAAHSSFVQPISRRRGSKLHGPSFLANAFVCFIPMAMFMEIGIVGRLFVAELLLLCILPMLLMARGRSLLAPLPSKLILIGLLWLVAQIVTDTIRSTPFEDWSRGWAKIVFFLLNFAAIYLLLNQKKERLLLFATGIALGQILSYWLNPNVYAGDYPWKFGYGFAITLLVILGSTTRMFESRIAPGAIALAMGALNLFMGFRSLGAICLLAAGWWLVTRSKRFDFKTKLGWPRIALVVLVAVVGVYGVTWAYEYSATAGWLGDAARDKYLRQSSGDLGILLGGRAEILASTQAIIDSPIIGHGSWAKDWTYGDILIDALREHGYQVRDELRSDLIPTHSYIMGAWVEAGVFGAVFWLWALALTIRALIATQDRNSALPLLTVFVAFNLFWNIPFSPFGAEGRLYTAYNLSLMMFALAMQGPARKRKASL